MLRNLWCAHSENALDPQTLWITVIEEVESFSVFLYTVMLHDSFLLSLPINIDKIHFLRPGCTVYIIPTGMYSPLKQQVYSHFTNIKLNVKLRNNRQYSQGHRQHREM